MAKKKTSLPPSEKPPTLAVLRRQLDKIDKEILALLNGRAKVAQQIGNLKRASNKAVYDISREQEVVNNVVQRNQGPLSKECVGAIYRELISGSRAIQAPLQVAYLGPQYTYTHLAAIHQFGQSADLVPVSSIASIFEEVERGHADYGLVPMENSTDGRVTDAFSCFAKSPVRICAEVPLRIRHCLLGACDRKDIKTVYSKPQALSQCRTWIAKHLPGIQTEAVASTAEAARLAREEPGAAAIASEQAGINNQLQILARNIEDNPDNITRFAVIGESPGPKTGNDKTTLMIEVNHEPGALADMMAIFKRNKLNMTWIESFPIPGARGEYLFFIEFEGHPAEMKARRAITSIQKKALRLEVLGSYAGMEPVG